MKINWLPINVGNYTFDGPFPNSFSLRDESGVYVILDNRNEEYHLIDVGESEEVRSRVSDHPRRDCWERERQGVLTYSALYVNEQRRMTIEQEIRNLYNHPCGER